MINRYVLACILSTCYLSSEVMASNAAAAMRARQEALRRQQQQAAAAVAPVVNVDKPLANEGRALQGLGTLFGADPNTTAPSILSDGMKGEITEVRALQGLGTLFGANDPNATAPSILSDGMKGEITQVRALQGVGDLVSVADFEKEPYKTALHANARAQLGRVHAFSEKQDLVGEANFEQEPYKTALHADARAQLRHVHDFHEVTDLVGEDNFGQDKYTATLSDAARRQLGHVHDFHEVDDLIAEDNFGQDKYTATLSDAARTQLGRVHAFHEVTGLADVANDALNDGKDNAFTTVLNEELRHQMKGLQMVLKPSSIPDNLYQDQDGMAAGFGTALRNFLTIATAQDIKDNRDDAQLHVNKLIGAIAVAATRIGYSGGHLGAWQEPIQTLYDKTAPTRADYLGLIHGMANDMARGGKSSFTRVYLLSPLKAIIRDMLIHFPQ